MDLSASDFIHSVFLLAMYTLLVVVLLQMVWLFVKMAVVSAIVGSGFDARQPTVERRIIGYVIIAPTVALVALSVQTMEYHLGLGAGYTPQQDPGIIYFVCIMLLIVIGSSFAATRVLKPRA